MSTQFWGITGFAEQQVRMARVTFAIVLLLWFGPLAVMAGWSWWRWASWWLYAALAPLGFVWLFWWGSWLTEQQFDPGRLVLWWWGGLILASPAIALLMKGWLVGEEFLRPRDLQDHLEEQQRALAKKNRELSARAGKLADLDPPKVSKQLMLGAHVKGELHDKYLGVERYGSWISLGEELLNQHILIVGTTGAGKSETIRRLVGETLQAGERDVFFVDGKGDLALGREIAQLIYQKRTKPVPLFSLGTGFRGAVYHGFRGEAIDVYNRLGALMGVEEAQGNARYYANLNRDLLQLICYAPGGPPRSFEDLRERLNKRWLQTAYQNDPEESRVLEEVDSERLDSLLVHLRPLIRDFAPLVGKEGFVLEECGGAVFSLRTSSLPDTARRFLDFLIEDVKDFVGKRQRRPGLLIIDEFGAFQNEKIVALLTMARSVELGVILATQDVANLGKDEQTKRLILANTRTKLLMASDFPEEVAQLAGTIYQIEASIQHEEGLATGMGSARVQHAFRVDMNEAAQLLPGETFLIRQRNAVKVRIKSVGAIAVSDQALAKVEKSPARPIDSGSFQTKGNISDLII